MTVHIYRVTVRGHFADLDDDQRAALLAEADEHTVFRSAFTKDGTFTYEPNLVAFNFRYEVRQPDDDGDPRQLAEEHGLSRALASLSDWGLGHKHVRVTVADMAEMWRG